MASNPLSALARAGRQAAPLARAIVIEVLLINL
jgi:hypothetical protein